MDVFVARQPIFDVKQQVYGYELLYRNSIDNFNNNIDGDQATLELINNSFLTIGIHSLTEEKKAFINFTGNLLKQEIPLLFPQDKVVVEILEDVEPEEEIIQNCKKLKEKNYIIALDDFVFHKRFEPLIELADIIKVDFLANSHKERKEIIEKVSNPNIKFLAEKVETREDFEEALKLGYSYFQGYFFSKPMIVSRKQLPSFKVNQLNLLREIQNEEVDFNVLASIIERDLSLSYKLLRLVNSAAYYSQNSIHSIKQALVTLGVEEIRKWIGFLFVKGMEDKKETEVIKSSIIRAKFGELIAMELKMEKRKSEFFLMGMFSMMDVLMQTSLNEILKDIPISQEIKDALLEKENFLSKVYKLIIYYEKGKWDNVIEICNEVNLDKNKLVTCFVEAVNWQSKILEYTV